MEYKGYIGKVEFDVEAGIFHGDVVNTRDVITFEGVSVAEIRKAFRESVDVYLDFCKERGEEPDKPLSGQFVTRITPELHRRASVAASIAGKSLNAWVAEQLQTAVDSGGKTARSRVAKQSKANGKGRRTSNSRRRT